MSAVEEVVESLLKEHSQQHETTQFLVMIGRLVELIPPKLGVQRTCRELTRIVIEETGFENCSILLWDEQNGCLALAAADGLESLIEGGATAHYNQNLAFAADEGLAGQAFSSRTPVFIEDAKQAGIPSKADSVVQPVSLVCVPLREVGVLNVSSYRVQRFTAQTRRYWELIGKIVGHLFQGLFHQPTNGKAPQNGLTLKHQPDAPSGSAGGGVASPLMLTEDALQYIPQGICVLDAEGKVTRVNPSIEKCYGGSASDLIGRSPSVIFHDPSTFHGIFNSVASSQLEELSDVPLVNAEGEVYSADLNLVKMKGRSGEAKGYLLIINDVTKKKAFADKMLQAEKLAALGTMAGGVAHDFNNLLMAILGNLQLVLPQIQEEEMLRRLKNIEKAVQDGANTVRRLQKFTERDIERQLMPMAADINDAIKDVVEMTRPRWKNAMEKHGHTIQFDLELGPKCFSKIHVSDFREVLTNLVFNAVDAMPQGGKITVRTWLARDTIVIEASDSGIGMSPEVAARIFDPFYTTKGVGNSGLGLSVSWSLIARSGGEIQVKSKPGKGTTFTIRLPKTEPPEKVFATSGPEKPPSCHRLLVVDDDEGVLGIIQDMFRFKGYRVVAVSNGEEALEVIDRENFDLVVTDLGMPRISGWEIAKKAKDKNPKMPVVLLTGWGTVYEDEDVSAEGVDIVLSKPLSLEKLVESVGKLL